MGRETGFRENGSGRRRSGMKILQKSILLEIAASFGLGSLVFSAALLTNEVSRRLMEILVQEDITLKEAGLVFLCILPKVLTFSIPMSALLGILICFGRLSADSEITAMRSCGIGLRNLLSPVLAFSAIVCMLALLNSNLWSPRATHRLTLIKDEIAIKLLSTAVQRGVFEERFPDRVLYIMDTPPDRSSWKGVFLAEVTETNWPKATFSRRGHLINHPGRRELQLHLQQGATYEVVPGKEGTVRVISFDEATVPLYRAMISSADAPKDKTIAEMDTLELYAKVFSEVPPGDDLHRRRAIIELNQRLALPLAIFVFSILGLPLGVFTRRSGKSFGFVISLVIFLVYFILFSQGLAFAESGHIPAFLGPWLANLVFLVLGLFLLLTSERQFSWGRLFRPLVTLLWSRARGPRKEGVGSNAPGQNRRRRRAGNPHFPAEWTLDKYILSGFLKLFLLVLSAFIVLFVLFTFFELLSDIVEQGISGWVVMDYFLYLVPHIVVLMIPFSILVAALVNFSLLTRTSQIVAMKASGISLYRLSSSVLLAALLLSAGSFMLQEYILPSANQKQDDLRRIIKGRNPQTKRPTRKWMMGEQDRIFHYNFFDDELNVFNRISVFDFDPQTLAVTRMVFAEKAWWDRTRSGWVFEGGWAQGFSHDRAQQAEFLTIDRKLIRAIEERPDYFKKEVRQSSKMSYQELGRYVDDLSRSGFDVVRLTVAWHSKLSFPLVSLTMAVIAIPFAVSTGQRGSLYGIGVSIVVGISYWVLQGFFEQIGSAGKLEPLLAAWAPNLIFGAGGVYLLFTVRT